MAVPLTFASICTTGKIFALNNLFFNFRKKLIRNRKFNSAPSGSYGTMVYIAKAVASVLDCLPQHGDMDCTIS